MARFTAAGAWQRDADRAASQHGSIDQTQYVGTKGDDHLHGRAGGDTIDGRAGDDRLAGRAGDDVLLGGKGNDVLVGGFGLDRLEGGEGDDVLRGGNERQEVIGAAQDLLFGGGGNDRLIGGLGADLLVGGAGADRFIFHAPTDSTFDVPDSVDDFEQSRDELVFRGSLHSDYDLHFIGQDAFSHVAGEVRFEVFSDNSSILIDLDGDGAADFRIGFNTAVHFQASDFSF